jgi:DNA-binding response OmpR family regulator
MNKSEDKHRILIVDDDIALRDLVVNYLSASGYPVEEAGDGTGMRTVLGKYTVDLVVLDLMLPGKDGLSLLRWLHEHHGPPVIIVSARGDEAVS